MNAKRISKHAAHWVTHFPNFFPIRPLKVLISLRAATSSGQMYNTLIDSIQRIFTACSPTPKMSRPWRVGIILQEKSSRTLSLWVIEAKFWEEKILETYGFAAVGSSLLLEDNDSAKSTPHPLVRRMERISELLWSALMTPIIESSPSFPAWRKSVICLADASGETGMHP